MVIILLGPPGAGKGTQAKTLAQRLKLPHIATGDLLRQNVAQNSQLGLKAKDFMDKGALVPDGLVTEMLGTRIARPDIQNGLILDGYPRNISQAKALDEILKERNMAVDMVVYLDTSEPVIIQRLSGRLVCSVCGANFHTQNMPPKVAMTCDNCGGRLYQRSDDKIETIKKRLKVYLDESWPLIQYYNQRQILHRLLADGEAETVLNKIVELAKEQGDPHKV